MQLEYAKAIESNYHRMTVNCVTQHFVKQMLQNTRDKVLLETKTAIWNEEQSRFNRLGDYTMATLRVYNRSFPIDLTGDYREQVVNALVEAQFFDLIKHVQRLPYCFLSNGCPAYEVYDTDGRMLYDDLFFSGALNARSLNRDLEIRNVPLSQCSHFWEPFLRLVATVKLPEGHQWAEGPAKIDRIKDAYVAEKLREFSGGTTDTRGEKARSR